VFDERNTGLDGALTVAELIGIIKKL
jgi:hypothetical protein